MRAGRSFSKKGVSAVIAAAAVTGVIAVGGMVVAEGTGNVYTGCLEKGLITKVKIGTEPEKDCGWENEASTWPMGVAGADGPDWCPTGASGTSTSSTSEFHASHDAHRPAHLGVAAPHSLHR